MRSLFFLPVTLLSVCSHAITTETFIENCNRIGIQGALATGGNLGIGVVNFTPHTELGATFSGSVNNARYETRTFTPVIFGGLRLPIGESTFFAYGIDALGTFGRIDGLNIHSDYAVGPYISLEQMLTYHFMLSGWILPYQYQHQTLGTDSFSTNRYFAAGGLAINYLF